MPKAPTDAAAIIVSEANLQANVISMAELCGWRLYHTHDSRRSNAGFPDLILIRGGALIVLELKSERGRVTTAQLAWLDDFAAVPGVVVARVLRPSHWKAGEIDQYLKRGPR